MNLPFFCQMAVSLSFWGPMFLAPCLLQIHTKFYMFMFRECCHWSAYYITLEPKRMECPLNTSWFYSLSFFTQCASEMGKSIYKTNHGCSQANWTDQLNITPNAAYVRFSYSTKWERGGGGVSKKGAIQIQVCNSSRGKWRQEDQELEVPLS